MDQYRNQLFNAIEQQDAYQIAALLNLDDQHISLFAGSQPEKASGDRWEKIIQCHINVVLSPDITAKFKYQFELLENFSQIFDESNGWIIPVMRVLIRQFRALAILSQDESSATAAINLINTFFSTAQRDRNQANKSLKMGLLCITNEIVKLNVFLNSSEGIKGTCKKIDDKGDDFPKKSLSGKADLVTYYYYRGRFAISEGEFDIAHTCLCRALENCPSKYFQQTRLILKYLIPVRLVKDTAPKAELLKKYKLEFFQEIIVSVKKGSISTYCQLLEVYDEWIATEGLLLLFERLKYNVYRNLFRRVSLLVNAIKQSQQGQLDLKVLSYALNLKSGTSISANECNNIVASLCYKKYINGLVYSQEPKSRLVLQKSNPFPLKSLVQP